MKFLKNFGWGILWALLFPFLVVGIALIAVYGIGVFFVEFILMIIHFFQGKKLFPMFPEDKEAYRIKLSAYENANAQQAQQTPAQQISNTQNTFIQQNIYNQHNPYASMPYPQQPPYMQNPFQQNVPPQQVPTFDATPDSDEPKQIESGSSIVPASFPDFDKSEEGKL